MLKIFSATVAGTTMMTLFSYWLSGITGKQFREPELLSSLMKRLGISFARRGSAIDGWILHYVAGGGFVIVYDQIWRAKEHNRLVKNGALLGAVSGFIGAEVWRFVLRSHPNPPKLDFKNYYNQLVIAHIIFGIFSAAGYQLPNKLHQLASNSKRTLSAKSR